MIENLNNLDAAKTGGKVSKIDMSSIPGFSPANKSNWDPLKHRIKYKRINVQNEDELSELERIETLAIRDEGLYILSKERFVFMDQILILVQYMEKVD